jgi:hypothetical protein
MKSISEIIGKLESGGLMFKEKRKGLDDMHTLTSTPQIKKLDPKDVDEIEM